MIDIDKQRMRERIICLQEKLADVTYKYEELREACGFFMRTPERLKLCRTEAKFLACLLSRPICSKEQVRTALYIKNLDEIPESDTLHVWACALRKKLKPFNLYVTTVWGVGYKMANEDKEVVKNMMKEEGLNTDAISFQEEVLLKKFDIEGLGKNYA